jgi:hemerythrin-like domain-containing protein
MTNPPYEGATPEQLRHPLVHELLAVHQMFRNELATILRYVNELTAGEQSLSGAETNARVQRLILVGAQYTQMLHMHHHLETSALFPPLQQEGLEKSVVDRLNAEHDEIAVMIDNFSAAIRRFSTIEPGIMDTDLRRLAEALHAHLAYEETHVCPFLARFSGWPVSNFVE